jgi:hypothetical protein
MGHAAGSSGSLRRLTRDVFVIALEMMREERWTTLLAPVAALIPLATVLNFRQERKFVRHWSTKILGEPEVGKQPYWISTLTT